MNDLLVIRAAQPTEAPILTTIACASKAYWGYDAAFLAACAKELTISSDDVARYPTYVLLETGHILGFYLLLPRDHTVVELDYLYLVPDAIGRGYGRLLFEHARHMAQTLHFQIMQTQADPYAAAFYGCMGMKHIGTRPSGSVPGRSLPLLEVVL